MNSTVDQLPQFPLHVLLHVRRDVVPSSYCLSLSNVVMAGRPFVHVHRKYY